MAEMEKKSPVGTSPNELKVITASPQPHIIITHFLQVKASKVRVPIRYIAIVHSFHSSMQLRSMKGNFFTLLYRRPPLRNNFNNLLLLLFFSMHACTYAPHSIPFPSLIAGGGEEAFGAFPSINL